MGGSSTTSCGGWPLPEQVEPGPLPRPSLRLSGVFLLVVVVGLGIGWLARGEVEVAQVGRPAPDFTVPVIGDGVFTLSDHVDGGPVVINLWASWCLPCRVEIPEISAFADSNPGVTVIGVAVEDTAREAEAFALEVGASYPLAVGDAAFEAAYPRLGLPATYILEPGGTVVEVFNGMVTEELLDDLVLGR